MYIGERIHDLLKEKGIKQNEFAEKTGIAKSTVNNWKTKNNTPSSEHIIPICDFFEVNIYWLLTGEGERDISEVHSKTEGFSGEERQLIYNWRELSERRKGRVENFIEAQLEEQRTEDVKRGGATG